MKRLIVEFEKEENTRGTLRVVAWGIETGLNNGVFGGAKWHLEEVNE